MEESDPRELSTSGGNNRAPYSVPIGSSTVVKDTLNAHYAMISGDQDPFFALRPVPDNKETIHSSLCYLSQPVYYNISRFKYTINGVSAVFLSDTGATIMVIRADWVKTLKLSVDNANKLIFTTANEQEASTRVITQARVFLDEISLDLECHVAYNLVHSLSPVLRFPDFSAPFELHTDGACSAGIGVILCQRDLRTRRAYVIAYASRSLTPAERNYDVSEMEALAIVWGIKKFAHYLTGIKFTVITDYHALQFLRNIRNSDLRERFARWALSLQQHDFTIVYRPGSQNSGPDALSRHPVDSVPAFSTLVCSL